jgi:hypothetical protein
VWVDGDWHWEAGRWVWQRGAWVKPPDGVSYCPSRVRYTQTARVLYRPSTWQNEAGRQVEAPPVIRAPKIPAADRLPESVVR